MLFNKEHFVKFWWSICRIRFRCVMYSSIRYYFVFLFPSFNSFPSAKIYWLSHNIQPNLWLWFLFLYSFPVGSSDLYVTCRIKWESDLLCAVEHPRLFWFQWESRDSSIAFCYSSFLHLGLLVFSLTTHCLWA